MNSHASLRRVGRGFTLIEMVVALALVALISTAIFESLKFGQRTYRRVVTDGAASWEIFAGQRLIRNIVESAYPQEPPRVGLARVMGLEGDRESVAITAPAPLAAGSVGFLRYELSLRRTSEKANDMMIRWWPESAGDSSVGAEPTEEVLIENVASVQWSYLGQSSSPGLQTSEAAWLDTWKTQSLPRLVRLRIRFDEDDSRRWPDLIMAPRITDDANCIFDAVAQRCRAAP